MLENREVIKRVLPELFESCRVMPVDAYPSQLFDTLAAVVSGLDARGVAALYDRLRPLFRDAYRDLGYPRADFDLALNRAIRKILEAPELDRRPELEPALQTYEYADPELEALPPVQKWMLRLGPENSDVVKSKLREIAAALDREQVAGADSEP